MKLANPLTLEWLCALGHVSRAGFYRWREAVPATDADLDLRDEIQRIALEFPCYGWPRVTKELHRRGWRVNHKRVYRIMREDNLLCLRKRKFVPVTTQSNHHRPLYPNLANDMPLDGINQLWVADITYLRLQHEFVYLAVILDAFSRRVVGWALEPTLEDELTLAALRMALERRRPAAGLVHHSESRSAVCFARLQRLAAAARYHDQHESEGQSVRQCLLRIVHENAEIRGGASRGIPQLSGSSWLD
jgi:putative transposase